MGNQIFVDDPAEFESNLIESGYVRTLSKDGKADIFTKGEGQYTVREQSNSGWIAADAKRSGDNMAKIRLGGQ
jgi:hypothetical protein